MTCCPLCPPLSAPQPFSYGQLMAKHRQESRARHQSYAEAAAKKAAAAAEAAAAAADTSGKGVQAGCEVIAWSPLHSVRPRPQMAPVVRAGSSHSHRQHMLFQTRALNSSSCHHILDCTGGKKGSPKKGGAAAKAAARQAARDAANAAAAAEAVAKRLDASVEAATGCLRLIAAYAVRNTLTCLQVRSLLYAWSLSARPCSLRHYSLLMAVVTHGHSTQRTAGMPSAS